MDPTDPPHKRHFLGLPAGTKQELIRLVHEVRGGKPIVRVLVLREVEEESP